MASNPKPEWDARTIALEILRAQRVAVIATADGGEPWASTVFYADEGFTLYVNTPNGTRMLRNMRANPRVSFAIDERAPTYFLQAAALARLVDDPIEYAHARELLAVKVPEAHVGHPSYTLVKLVSQRVYVSDYRGGYRPRAELIVSKTSASHQQGDP